MAADTGEPVGLTRSVRARRWLRGLLTVLTLLAAYLLAYELRFEFRVPDDFRRTALLTAPGVLLLKLVLLRAFGVQRHSWRFTSLWDLVSLTGAMLLSSALLLAFRFAIPPVAALGRVVITAPVPLGVIAADLALSILGLVGVRAIRRMQAEQHQVRRLRGATGNVTVRRVVILGAGEAGGIVAREIAKRPDLGLEAVGFLDDDPGTRRQRIHGLDVLGTTELLPWLVADQHLDEAIIAMPRAGGATVRRMIELCLEAGVEPRIVPGVLEMLDGRVSMAELRPVRIEDLLRRDAVELNTSAIAALVGGECVVVTGAGGSIGSELARQLARYGPRKLLLVDRAEPALWAIHRDVSSDHPDLEVLPAIADVCDLSRVGQLFAEHRPSLVFHAAAHKHVPMMEVNPGEAVKNNVLGTRVMADAALEAGVERFVLVSTDKAVNPTSVMGASKRIAERYVQHLALRSGRMFVSVRFGNVLGSTGSVVPIFEQQIAAGGPVTVTHPDMCRYFMTIPEASSLVIQAASVGHSGDLLLLDMGEPVHIVDLARDLIRLKGLRPDVDVPIVFSGIRPGEKLYEELAFDAEHTDPTAHPSILLTRSATPDWPAVETDLKRLEVAAASGDAEVVRQIIAELVPEMAVGASASSGRERRSPPVGWGDDVSQTEALARRRR